jgi:ActR/RegA family two-component response regulator
MRKALVVEDDLLFAQRVAERLMLRGIEVTHCRNEPEASTAIVRSRYDYFLIDLMLPPSYELEGLAVFREALRRHPSGAVLLMTSRDRGTVSIVSDAMALGAREFFDKNDALVLERIVARLDKIDAEAGSGVFISHGHNELLKYKLADFVANKLGRRPVILAEQPSAGLTVVEKLEKVSRECSFAVILMTQDDEVASGTARARQNVVHELGFFQGRYGRGSVVLIVESGLELFSNISGIVYIGFEANRFEAAFESLRTEIEGT